MNSHLLARTRHPRSAERKAIVLALQDYRRTWQEASQDNRLTEVEAPVGLVIADIAEGLGLTSDERRAVLGTELSAALARLLKEPVQLK